MRFSITVHSGSRAPADALDLLVARVGERYEDTRFSRAGREIRAVWGEDAPISMERDEREEVGRLAVLGVLERVCEEAPELQLDWYAVAVRRD